MERSIVLYLTTHVPSEINRAAYQRANQSCENYNTIFLTRRSVAPDIENKSLEVRQAGESFPMRVLFPLWLIWNGISLYRNNNNIRHIHTNHSPQSLIAGWILSLLGITWISDIYDSPHISLDLNAHSNSIVGLLSNYYNRTLVNIVKRTLNSADLIIISMVPEIMSQYGISPDDDNVFNVTNGTNVDRNRAVEPSDVCTNDFQIIYVGSLLEERGADTMLSSMKHLDDQVNNVSLHLVGAVKSETARCKITNLNSHLSNIKICIHGYVPHDDALKRIVTADVALCPLSLEVENYQYAYPIKVIEYMSVGTPTVATKTRGTSELLSKGGGILVQADDPKAMANAIRKLYDDSEKRRKMSQEAKNISEEYRWEKINSRINSKITEVNS